LVSLLERYCTLPDPLKSDEQAERRGHRDLELLDRSAMRHELAVIRWWLPLQRAPHRWFRERVRLIEAALRHGL
jgi:hypothetical protein